MKIQNQIKKSSYLIFFLILTIIITIPIILFNSNLEAQIIDAQVDIEPNTINLSSTGIWITYIVLSDGDKDMNRNECIVSRSTLGKCDGQKKG